MNIIKASTDFYGLCLTRLLEKAGQGWYGWDEERYRSVLSKKLHKNVASKSWVDVANFAMMLHCLDKQKDESWT